jgi:3-deoxy-manno-octulosonate cytidylyltransferase (CMP-KDO synthetase)
MSITIVIPARLKSTRFPRKPLALILGKPMVIHTAERAALAVGSEHVYIATDSGEIREVVESYGFNVTMTGEEALTGTDRIAEAIKNMPGDVFVNVQGDEPMIDPESIRNIIAAKEKYIDSVVCGMGPINPKENPRSVHIPKVITTEDNKLIYMSRLAVPGYKTDATKPIEYLKQICVYAFSREHLEKFTGLGRKSYLESCEDIELLRCLDLGIPVRMIRLTEESLAVDIPEDIAPVEEALRAMEGNS